MKILIVSGSRREDRKSHRLALYLEKTLESKGYDVELFDTREYEIPLLEDIYSKLKNPHEGLVHLKSLLDHTDHIIVVTPEYNGHFSPAIKNTLDHFKPEYSQKVIGVATASAGKMGGIRASIHMQSYVLALGAYPVPKIGLTPEVQHKFDEKGNVTDESIVPTMDSFLSDFLFLAHAVTYQKGANE